MRKQRSIPCWLLLLSSLIYFSCRKSDLEKTLPEKPPSFERFFKVSQSADPRLKAIAESIRTQEKQHPFLKKFTQKTGWPVWDKVKIIGNDNNLNSPGTSEGEGSSIVYIPFVKDSMFTVNAVLAVKIDPSDTTWKILHASDYASFGFNATNDTTWNGRNVFNFFASFQHDIFGHNRFLITDNRLFNSPTDTTLVILKKRNGVPVNGTSRSMDWISVTQCDTWAGCGGGDQTRSSSINDCYEVEICNTYYYDVDLTPGGGTSWTGSSWSGNGNSGGSGSWGSSDPCVSGSCYAAWLPDSYYNPVYVNGILYTTNNYPGINNLLPWKWWETGAGNTPSGAHLDLVMSLITELNADSWQSYYLAFHPVEAQELKEAIEEELNVDELGQNVFINSVPQHIRNAAVITIDVMNNGQVNGLWGAYDITWFTYRIGSYFPDLLSNAAINPAFMIYFSVECAIIRSEHPNWPDWRIFLRAMSNTLLEIVHTGLDIAGLIPAVGEIADLANGVIYTLQGDGVNATFSYAAAIPITGWFSTAAKYAKKVITALDGSTRTLKWVVRNDGIIEFGDRNLLRKVLGLAKGDARLAHHIIPWEHGVDDLVQKAAQKDFNLNEILNGIPLTSAQHIGGHALYNQKVKNKLVELWNANGGNAMSTDTASALVRSLANSIRNWITSHPNTSINDIVL